MYNINHLTVNDYLQKIAEPDFPNPSSGSAAAVTAAMAAALLEMSCKVTLKKDKQKSYLLKTIKTTEEIRMQCLFLATEDMRAYAGVVKSLKSKNEFPNEYEAAMKKATETLVSLVKNCELILTYIEQVIKISYIKVLGDLGGGVNMAEAAAAAAKLGVEINLRLVHDENYKTEIRNSVQTSYENCAQAKDRILNSLTPNS